MDNKVNFGNNLRRFRKLRKLTQEQLAEIIEAESGETISRYENGKNYPNPERITRIVKALDIDYKDLLDSLDSTTNNESEYHGIKLINNELKNMTDDELIVINNLIKAYKKSIKTIKKSNNQ